MATVYLRLSGVIDYDKAVAQLRELVSAAYRHEGNAMVEANMAAIDAAPAAIKQIDYPATWAQEKRSSGRSTDRSAIHQPHSTSMHETEGRFSARIAFQTRRSDTYGHYRLRKTLYSDQCSGVGSRQVRAVYALLARLLPPPSDP